MDELYEAGDIAGAVEYELRMWVDGPDRGPDAVDPEMRERVREMNAALFTRDDDAGEEIPLDPPAAERLAEISAPTLIVYGDKDVMDVRQAAGPLAAAIPGARLAVIPDAAHLPQMERPEVFNEIVLGFLREVASTRRIERQRNAVSSRMVSSRAHEGSRRFTAHLIDRTTRSSRLRLRMTLGARLRNDTNTRDAP